MNVLACGISHKTTPLALREQAYFSVPEIPGVLQELIQLNAANEAVVLSTCNRTELYLHQPCDGALSDWLKRQNKLLPCLQNPHWYQYQGDQALKHLLRVTTGLDSLMLGEPQIFGQVKQAFALAKAHGGVKQQFDRLFQQIFSYSKLIRHETEIGKNAVSIAYIALKLIQNIFANTKQCRALLVGAGEMIELIATHLHSAGISDISIANRNLTKAQQLAEKFSAKAIQLSEIPMRLAESEIVITATASSLPIIGKGAVERALKLRKHRPIFMLDAAVPRDIEQEVAQLEDVYLYSMDDLREIVAKNMNSRKQQSAAAEEMIELCSQYVLRNISSLEASDVIARMRGKVQSLSQKELAKAQSWLARGMPLEEILHRFANGLTNKILHTPSVNLRLAAENKRKDLLKATEDLFEL